MFGFCSRGNAERLTGPLELSSLYSQSPEGAIRLTRPTLAMQCLLPQATARPALRTLPIPAAGKTRPLCMAITCPSHPRGLPTLPEEGHHTPRTLPTPAGRWFGPRAVGGWLPRGGTFQPASIED